MASTPSKRRSKRRYRLPSPNHVVWLIGVVLGFAVVGATLYAFAAPPPAWILGGLALLALAFAWEAWGALFLTLALSIGINWTVESGMGFFLQLFVTTLLAVLVSGAVAMLVAEARRHLQAQPDPVQHRLVLLGTSGMGVGVGCLVGVAIAALSSTSG